MRSWYVHTLSLDVSPDALLDLSLLRYLERQPSHRRCASSLAYYRLWCARPTRNSSRSKTGIVIIISSLRLHAQCTDISDHIAHDGRVRYPSHRCAVLLPIRRYLYIQPNITTGSFQSRMGCVRAARDAHQRYTEKLPQRRLCDVRWLHFHFISIS
jgi:hypothetical protein